MNNPFRWRLGALAGAIAVLGSFSSFDAQAMALGRVTVQSALGEPLRAEIDIADINAEEAATLRAGPASAEAFRAAGLDYTSAMAELQVSLQRRANGRAYLRLSTTRPVTEPFVDLILEANWASGRIVRDYTMLFDPPSLRGSGVSGSSVAPTAPLVSGTPSASPAPVPSTTARPAPSSASVTGPVAAAPRPAPVPRVAPSAPVGVARAAPPITPVGPSGSPASGQVTVKAGDTAGRIAAQSKPASVSLDQMLLALLNSNPDAFIGGNINRLKSGAVLDIPSADTASAVAPAEASRTIVAQAKNFNEFRRSLAQSVPAAQIGEANRQAAGQVQAKVEDRAPATVTPDKLTLSKGAVQGHAAAEEKIARERQASDTSTRVAELSKNIADLNKIAGLPAPTNATTPAAPGTATASTSAAGLSGQAAKTPSIPLGVNPPAGFAAPPAVVASAAGTPAAGASAAANQPASAASAAPPAAEASAVAPTPAVAASGVPAPATPASAATAVTSTTINSGTSTGANVSAAPAAVTSGPAVTAPARVVPIIPVPASETSLLDELTENPLLLPGLGALLLLLAGFGFYRYRQRNNPAQVDSSFLESRLQPDSFFGASGGQRIDTSEGPASGSSLVYSPSQLDAAGDVDPVAEADVYLAYGRDLQAEEILKEAMRTTPGRVAIHSKLMEIYAKRRDAKAFEVVAAQAFALTRGEGPDWAYVSEMGRDLDPGNPLYQPGGQPAVPDSTTGSQAPYAAAAFGSSTLPQVQPPAAQPAGPVDFDLDLDLDLDFSLDDEPPTASAPVPAPTSPVVPPVRKPEPALAAMPETALAFDGLDGLDLDFSTDTDTVQREPGRRPAVAAAPVSRADGAHMPLPDNVLEFDMGPLTAIAREPEPQKAPAIMDAGMLEFDMDSLSLDLDAPVKPDAKSADVAIGTLADDPLETKFSLAEEFRALGDMDGARSLAEEVLAEASGALKTRAQTFINALP